MHRRFSTCDHAFLCGTFFWQDKRKYQSVEKQPMTFLCTNDLLSQRFPQRPQLPKHLQNHQWTRSSLTSFCTRIMGNIHLLPPHTGLPSAHEEFCVEERPSCMLWSYALPEIAAEHFHGAVQIAHPHPENEPGEKSEALRIHLPQQRICALPAPTNDKGECTAGRQQLVEILGMKLPVTVHECHPLRGCGIATGPHGSAISLILRMRDNAQARVCFL